MLGFAKRIYVDASEPAQNALTILSSYRPDMIYSYPSSLYLIAKEMRSSSAKQFRPNLLIGTGELIDYGTRRFIEEAFGLEMLDFYGCIEVERSAWECPERAGYHMDVDSVITEFVKGNEVVSPGERGELTLTCLYNYAMPLIRYDIEDTGIPINEKCPCGRNLPLMRKIEGRSNDFVVLEDGRMISPLGLLTAIWKIPANRLSEYKVIQMRKNYFIIEIVSKEDQFDKLASDIRHNMKKIVGYNAHVEVRKVEEIQKSPSGKTKSVVSYVPRAF
jgi:phenylacetate-CoA ligase